MPDPFLLSVVDDDNDGPLPVSFSQKYILVRDVLWPCDVETGVDDDL